MLEIVLGIGLFTLIVLLLVMMILLARDRLVPRGSVSIGINHDAARTLRVSPGAKLLEALKDKEIFLSSACGGKGTCGQCRVTVIGGGGDILPTERSLISNRRAGEGERLACQVSVKQDLEIELPPQILSVRQWRGEVVSNRNVASFIKELVLRLPEGESLDFEPGGYVTIEAPAHRLKYTDIPIDDRFRDEWDNYGMWRLESIVDEPVQRPYSMANYPGEGPEIKLNVRIATPPPGRPDLPPGKMSSYLFSLRPGDQLKLSGPFGDFHPSDTQAEMIYIGGGAGMAPLRSHIFHLLKQQKTARKISYWYGARSLRELFYQDDFAALAREHANFTWHVALSDPKPEDHWQGDTGYIHQVVLERYLRNHPAPEDSEYYLCGPPVMLRSVMAMLEDLGVGDGNIFYDDFGS